MSNQIQVTHNIESFGVLDFTTKFASPLVLPGNNSSQNLYLQVNSITISDRIPNIFDARPYYDFNNTLLRIGTDTVPYQTVQLNAGLYYTADLIGDAINAAINTLGWWINPSDPGFVVGSNSIIDKVYILFKTGKLNPAFGTRLKVDLRKSTSDTDLATTLGFSQGVAELQGNPLTNVSYTSDIVVKIDTQGSSCDIHSSLTADTRRNNTFSQSLAVVPFAGKTTLSDNVWPSGGQISPSIVYSSDRVLKDITIKVKTMDGLPMLFMNGRIFISISFSL